MKVLIITNLFPNNRQPGRGIFNKQQFAELAKLCDIKVIAPVPWRPGPVGSKQKTVDGEERLTTQPSPCVAMAGTADNIYAALRGTDGTDEAERARGKAKRHVYCDVVREEVIDGIEVSHPRWLVVPKIGRRLHGRFYYWGIRRIFHQLCDEWKPDVILATWAYPDAYAASLLAAEAGLPLVVKVHGNDINAGQGKPWRRRRIKQALNYAKAVVCVSRALGANVTGLGLVDEGAVRVIPNGVDTELFHPMDKAECRKQLGLKDDKKHIVFVGSLVTVKGLEYLIHALPALGARVMLHVVGAGRLRDSLKNVVAELGLTHGVIFHGRCAHEDVPKWMNAADVLCLPSLQEGDPNVVLEAIACGTPVVATKVVGLPEIIDDAEKGMLVAPEDSDALVKAIDKVLARTVSHDGGHPSSHGYAVASGTGSPTSGLYSWQDSAAELNRVLEEV